MAVNLEAFFRGDYMPHGHCYLWQPGILWTNVVSDLLIALAYFSIPVALIIIWRKRSDLQFRGLFLLFSCFILFCGITHMYGIYTVWHGSYGTQGLIKAATALVSVTAACALFANLPKALAYPSLGQYRRVQEQAQTEMMRRQQIELERKNEAIFRFTTELVPTGLLVVDANMQIRMANQALASMFGYAEDELLGKPLNVLIPDSFRNDHEALVKGYMRYPTQGHAMASGRSVQGRCKNGDMISIEIHLSVHEFENEQYTFASITNLGETLSEQQLQGETSGRIRRAIEATNDGIWEWNPQTDDVWFSPRMKSMIGRPENGGVDTEDHIEDWQQHIHRDDRAEVESSLQRHFAREGKFDVIYRGHVGSGQYEWLHCRGDTLFDEEQRPLLISGTLSNIHKLKTLEAELEQQTRFLNEVLERSLSGLYIYNLQKHTNTYINPEYRRLTGYSLPELEALEHQLPPLQLFHPDDHEAIRAHFKALKQTDDGEALGIEYRLRHRDGYWLWCYSRDSVYTRDAEGRPLEILGTFFDISELKQRESDIRRLALEFSMTFEQAAVGIAHISLQGEILKANSKLCEILDYAPEQLVGSNILDLTYRDDLAISQQRQQQLIAGEISQYVLEKRYIRANGEVFWANLTVAIARMTDPAENYFISVIEDISVRKKIELELAQSNHALERFAYSASHDLQEPLRKISAFADVLENRLKGKISDPDIHFQLERISDASRRMGSMIQSLLQLSRYSRKDLLKTPASLAQLVSQVKDDLLTLINRHQATIHLDVDMEIRVEHNGFQQVLRNLITNSILYAREDQIPAIELSAREYDDYQIITLSDNGQGLDPAHAQQIFEPFRRFNRKNASGTGMGLAICRQIIKAHGGSISASNREEPSGTVITIELPRN